MNTKNKSVVRWPLLAGYVGMVIVLLACATISGGGSPQLNMDEAVLRLEGGVVEVQNDNGDWLPVAGGATFELVGVLESTDPWQVAGISFETRESTQIDEGLEAGQLVKVMGVILEDDTWLAYSIERVEEQTDSTIILIGTLTSIDPWVVNEITLDVTGDTVISGEITPGMLVRVEILLFEDGTWEVLSIAPLGDFTEMPGCATVMATIVSMNGNEIQLMGWPAITLGEGVEIESDNGSEGAFSENQAVLVVVCSSEDGQVAIVQIIILNISDGEVPVEEGGEGEKVLVCHKPDKKGGQTLNISASAIPAHLGHGDKLGACP